MAITRHKAGDGSAKSAIIATAILFATAPSSLAFDLQLVHWNDVHARNTPATASGQQLCLDSPYNDMGCYGGHARLAAICKEAKAANPATLCIDAGDEFLGTAWDSLFQGRQTAPALAAAGADVMTAGNHEFDYGVAAFAAFIDSLPFPMLGGCNMDTTGEPALAIKKWHVFEVDGRKVALLGYIAEDTGAITSAGTVQFSDPVTAVPACMEEFKASPDSEGVNIIGLLSHAGVSVDVEVAAATPDADFIVSGHSHTRMFRDLLGPCLEFADGECLDRDESELPYPFVSSGTPILQQFFASKYAGVATLAFSDDGTLTAVSGRAVAAGVSFDDAGAVSTVSEDGAVRAVLDSMFQEVVAFSNVVIGALPVPGLSAARPDIRNREMAIGNAVCDAMLAALLATGFKESADAPLVCLANGGGIRADLPAGAVTYGDVTGVLPFGNFIEVLEISGATLKEALAFGFDSAQDTADPPGKFPHLGGALSVVLDYGESSTTVVSAQHDCMAIADDATFHLATNNFIAAGGDAYEMFVNLPRVLLFGPSVADSLADYIGGNTPQGGTVPEEAVDLEGRIVAVEDAEEGLCAVGAGMMGGTDGGMQGGTYGE